MRTILKMRGRKMRGRSAAAGAQSPKFIVAAILLISWAGLVGVPRAGFHGLLFGSTVAPTDTPKQRTERQRRVILNNDGGTLVGPNKEAPLGVEGLVNTTIEPLRGTHIDTLYWALGTDAAHGGNPVPRFSNVYSHDTQIGERWGEGRQVFESAGNWRIYENVRQLIAEGNDPPKVVIEHARRAGKEVFLSFRFNDCHDGLAPGWGGPRPSQKDLPMHHTLNRMKRDHPEWLLGPMAGMDFQHHRYAFNFAVDEVRNFKLALFEEAVSKYDPDGLDLDFCRHPRFFKEDEVAKNSWLMTDLLRNVRHFLDEMGKQRQKRYLLSVRVPPSPTISQSVGLEVRTWIKEGLIDILVCGSTVGCMQRLPIEEYVAACRGTGVQVYAHIGISPSWGVRRGFFALGFPYNEGYKPFTLEMYRAMAACYWAAGVDGLFLWNNHLIEYFDDPNWDRQPWREIGDPQLLARRDKHYLVDHDMSLVPDLGHFERNIRPPAELPVRLSDGGEVATVHVDIADDPQRLEQQGVPVRATARFRITQMTGRDQLRFELNERALEQSQAKVYIDYNNYWLAFDVTKNLRPGWNEFRAAVKSRNPFVGAPLTLEDLEVIVDYPDGGG